MSQSEGFRSRSLVSRRRVLRNSALIGAGFAGAVLVGCASAPKTPASAPKTPASGQAPQASGNAGGQERPGVPVVKGAVKEGGTWTTPITATTTQHDAHTSGAGSIWNYLSEPALMPDPWTGQPTANIVEKWEMPDSTTILLRVRKGVNLHDKAPWNGREFDAEDLAFNINRIAGNTAQAEGLPAANFQRADTLQGMSRVEVVDKYTVKVTMARPSSSYIMGFLDYRNGMQPKGIVEVGFKDPMKFAGVGAFQLTEFVPGVRVVFAKHPKYYRQGEPHFDKLVQTVVADKGALIAGFISRQFATFQEATPQDAQTIKAARPDALLYNTAGNRWFYIWPNAKFEAAKDFRVRKAIQLTINYEDFSAYYGDGWAYTGALFSGFAEAWQPDKIKSLPGFNPGTKAKDIAEAQKMMAAAGHENGTGIAFKILLPPVSNAPWHENALRFTAQMEKAFPAIKITQDVLGDSAVFAKRLTNKDFEMLSYAARAQPSAATEATAFYHSKGGRSYGGFANAAADALLEKAAVTLDLKERTAIFDTFQQKSNDEWVQIFPLFVQPFKTFVQPNIGGYDKVVGPWSQMPVALHDLHMLYNT